MRARGFVVAADTGSPVEGVGVVAKARGDVAERTLGLLSSDSAGYVSFDLSGGPADVPSESVWLEVVGHPEVRASIVDRDREASAIDGELALATNGAVAVLQVAPSVVSTSGAAVPLPSVQGTPDDRDYAISPNSFVSPRKLRVGDGNCAVPVRSALPVRTVGLIQIVRRPLVENGEMKTQETTDPTTDPLKIVLDPFVDATDVTPSILACDILDYEQSWCDLGECLGTLLYSLPLAPCESVNIAVIEAARSDEASRRDAVLAEEKLDHSVVRDRNIDETVKAALKESQGGSSFMAGHSGAYSGKFPIGQFGATHSLGYATTNSWGKRKLEGESVQELHDSTVQATDVVRSLNSTVIVQGTQAERHALETRTVTNHNHCHALTVQYYEVLRRMKLVTRFQRSRPGVLVPYHGISFKNPRPTLETRDDRSGRKYQVVLDPDREDLYLVNRLRPYLDAVLLQPEFAANFDAVRRLLFFEGASLPSVSSSASANDYLLSTLHVTLTRDHLGTDTNVVSLRLRTTSPGREYATFGSNVNSTDKFLLESEKLWPTWKEEEYDPQEIGPWTVKVYDQIWRRDLAEFEIHFDPGSGGADWLLAGLKVTALKTGGTGEEILVDAPDIDKKFHGPGHMSLPVPPIAVDAQPDPVKDAQAAAQAKAELRSTDLALAWELISHLHEHRDRYSELLIASKDTSWFAHALDRACGTLLSLRERIDSVPVAVSGGHLVFPLHPPGTTPTPTREPDDDGPLVQTSYISLPTRGLFGEAQLGTCNACEKRDVRRFWKWEESPCERPPDIEGITPGFRGQAPDLEPTDLPNAVVQITQPPAAPDPVGLAAALTLLGKGDAFRDMSGVAELQQLLSGLTSGAIGLAGAQQLAAEVQGKGAAAAGGGQGGGAPAEQSPAERYDNLQVAKEVAAEAEGLGWTPETTQAVTSGIVGDGARFPFDLILKMLLGAAGAGASADLLLHDKIPTKPEKDAVGAITAKILRGSPEFATLVKNTNANIVFKDEEGTAADRMMSPRLRDKLDALAPKVKAEWPGKKLRVTEAWDENDEHGATSSHYEGRAADITVSDQDGGKLGRLGRLAVDAGLDWVFYEDSSHVHVSVTK